MSTTSIEPVQHELGYFFHPTRVPKAIGHPQLDIVLRPAPTGRHFDPEKVHFEVACVNGGVESLTVHHPWRWPTHHYCVSAGRVIWRDRLDKTVEAFTFGGSLQIEPCESYTACVLTSPAPILRLVSDADIPTMLALEVEVLLAERRAAWVDDPASIEERVAAADPLVLYYSCLKALKGKFKRLCLTAIDNRLCQLVLFLNNGNGSHRAWRRPPHIPELSDLL